MEPERRSARMQKATAKVAEVAVTKKNANAPSCSSQNNEEKIESQLDNVCAACDGPITVSPIGCDICCGKFHDFCCGIPDEAVKIFVDIVQFTGWVCSDCRSTRQQKIAKLEKALANVTDRLSHITATLDSLQEKLQSPTCNTEQTVDGSVTSKSDIEMEIQRTLASEARRKKNVIITGLPEETESGIDDKQAFLTLCENHFSVKPSLSQLGCKRLGDVSLKYSSRKLLVHLTTDSAANDVLAEAKKLRNCEDPVIANTVYINPDQSPAASKLAYERRQKRRAAKERRNAQGTTQEAVAAVESSVVSGDQDFPLLATPTVCEPVVSAKVNQQSHPHGYTVINSSFRANK